MNPILTLHAPAKLNLHLTVGKLLPNGLHEIATLICPISLFDKFRLTLGKQNAGSVSQISFECSFDDPLSRHLAAAVQAHPQQAVDVATLNGPKNLASRAAVAFLDGRVVRNRTAKSAHLLPIKVEVIKGIPFLAGLGGGSADAALILQILQFLLGLELSPEELYETGSQFGSDIPAALAGCPVVVWGCGEKVQPLSEPRFARLRGVLERLHVVLLKPTQGVQTGEAYRMLDHYRGRFRGEHGGQHQMGDLTPVDGEALVSRCALEGVSSGLTASDPASSSLAEMGLLGNDFQSCVQAGFGEVDEAFQVMRAAGASRVQLSGSGSTVFALCDSAPEAERIVSRLEELSPPGWFFKRARFLTEAFPWSFSRRA